MDGALSFLPLLTLLAAMLPLLQLNYQPAAARPALHYLQQLPNGQQSQPVLGLGLPTVGQPASGQDVLQPGASQAALMQPAHQDQMPPAMGSAPTDTHRPDREGPIFRYQGAALNSTTVRLVWNLVQGFPADSFDIQWGPIPDADVFTVEKLNGSARDYTFHGLQPDTLYSFQLRAHYADRLYRPQLTAVRTPPANYVPKSHLEVNRDIMPLGVKAESKSNSTILLTWTEPDRPVNLKNSNRVNTIRYYINLTPSPNVTSTDQPQYHYRNITNARESRLIVQNLRPATEYAFAVKTAYYSPDMKRVFTQSGFSMDTIAKTFDLEPSAPRNFSYQELPATKDELAAGRQSLELSWLPPDSPNGQIKGYLILYAHDLMTPEDKWKRIAVDGATTNNWLLAKFIPGSSYYFKMRAINQRGPGADSETRLYAAPSLAMPAPSITTNSPVPLNNVFLLIVICMVAILFLLFVVVSHLACKTRRKPRKSSLNSNQKGAVSQSAVNGPLVGSTTGMPKLSGFASTNSNSSTVAARVGTLARRRDQNSNNKPDFWISAMDQQQQALEVKSNNSEKSNSDLNMAMVSIQRDSPQFATTQLAPSLPEYRFAQQSQQQADQQALLQQLQQSHYHTSQFGGSIAYDQMDSATASALMTLSKRQQQQLQKYQLQFSTNNPMAPVSLASNTAQAPSPHQQPPPPPPLNIEQQNHQQQSLYGTNIAATRSLRMHRPTLYDPVSGSFVQNATSDGGPPNYNSSHGHPLSHHHGSIVGAGFNTSGGPLTSIASNTLQLHPHHTSTLMSRRSTNTLRSFQNSAGTIYGQLGGVGNHANNSMSQFAAPPPPPNSLGGNQQSQVVLQSHQAVINQLNNSTYPSLPLKHVSTVRPQIMSSLEDQIELELSEKEPQQQLQLQQKQQQANGISVDDQSQASIIK